MDKIVERFNDAAYELVTEAKNSAMSAVRHEDWRSLRQIASAAEKLSKAYQAAYALQRADERVKRLDG